MATRTKGLMTFKDTVEEVLDREHLKTWQREFSFTFRGHSLSHKQSARVEKQMLTTLPVDPKTKKEFGTSSNLEIHSSELEPESPPDTFKRPHVGYYINNVKTSANEKREKRPNLTLKEPSESECLRVEEHVVHRVVMDYATEKTYALVPREDGLSVLVPVTEEQVFWFMEFMTADTAIKQRKLNWTKNAIQAAKLKNTLKNSGDPTRFISTPEDNLANNLIVLTNMLNKSPEPWILKRLKDLLEAADSDLQHKNDSFRDLWKLFDKRKDALPGGALPDQWEEGDEVEIMKQLENHWPEVKLEPEWFSLINRGLVNSGIIFVEYRLQRSFLVYAGIRLREMTEPEHKPEHMSDVQLGEFVKKVNQDTAMILGTMRASKPSIAGDTNSILAALRDRVIEILNKLKSSSEHFVDLNGSQIASTEEEILHPATIVNEILDANDQDSVRLAVAQLTRIPFAAITVLMVKVCQEPLERIVEIIDWELKNERVRPVKEEQSDVV